MRPDGRWVSHAPLPVEVVGFYVVIIVLLGVLGRPISSSIIPNPIFWLDVIVVIFLARFVSTTYIMDSERFIARRLFGSRSVRLEEVQRIEFANLRELSPTGFFGGWGWRGRMWSPVVGRFDSVHTRSAGVLVSEGRVPLFVSPRDPKAFAVELSRRVRSSTETVNWPGIPTPTGASPPPNGAAQ